MASKKNFHRFISSLNTRKKVLRTYKPSVEQLEPRQMLSAVAFTTVEDSTFQASFENQLDSGDETERCMVMEIASLGEGTGFDVSNLTITDSNDEAVKILSSKVENGVATILARYTLKETYVFEIATEEADPKYEVRFLMAGDLNGENEFSTESYYTLWGEVQKGIGVNSRFIETYKNIYGVNLSSVVVDPIYDLDGTGKLTLETFDTIIRPNYDDPFVLEQEITTVPTIKDLKVNGTEPELIEGEKYEFVTNQFQDLTLTGKTSAEECEFTYETDSGKTYIGTIDFTTSGTYTITNTKAETDTIDLTFVTNSDKTFSLAFPDDSNCDGSITLKLWSDAQHTLDSNSYVLTIVLDEPEVYVTDASVDDAQEKEGVFYVNSNQFSVTTVLGADDEATVSSITNAMEDSARGVYIRVYESEEEITSVRKKLDKSILGTDSEGNVTIEDVSIALEAEAGVHTYTIAVTDLAGNIYDEKTVQVNVTVDVEGPTITVTGYTENKEIDGQNVMLVDDESLTLKAVAEDDVFATLVCTQGETVIEVEEDGESYVFTLNTGLNLITFKATDLAGNSAETTCKVYYAEDLVLSEEGEVLRDEGLTHTYKESEDPASINLYDYFNYDSGLQFTFSVSDPTLAEISVEDGVMSFNYLKTPEEGETLSETITVTAKNSVDDSCELKFTLRYVRVEEPTFWTDTEFQNDLADVSLADVEHITSENQIVFTGTLTIPEGSSGVKLNVYQDTDLIYEDVSLEESSSGTDFDYELDETSGEFTLTLKNLSDAKYSLEAFMADSESGSQIETIYVETSEPEVVAEISGTSPASSNPHFTVEATGTPSPIDAELGTWVEIYYASASTPSQTTLYARAKYNVTGEDAGYFDDLTYFLTESLEDGAYIFTSQTINAASLTTDGNSQTIVIKLEAPTIIVSGYTPNYHWEDEEEYDSMLVTTEDFSLKVSANETGVTLTCTQNGEEVKGTLNEDGSVTFDFSLDEDLNSIVFTAVGATGLESTKTCQVVWAPTLSEAGETLQLNGLAQAVGSEKNRTVDLNSMFEFDGELSYSCESESEGSVKLNLSDEGILSIQWESEPVGSELFSASVNVTASAVNGDTKCELTFDVSISADTQAPVWQYIQVPNDVSLESPAEFDGYILNTDTVQVSGILHDDSEIVSAELTILSSGGETVHTVDLLTDYEGTDYTYTYDDETSAFTLELFDLTSDEYTFLITGTDEHGNKTSIASGDAQEIHILLEKEMPDVTAKMTVVKTGTSDTIVNQDPQFVITDEGEPSELDLKYGVWVQIYIENYAKTKQDVLYAQAKYDSNAEIGNRFSDLDYFLDTLSDGSYTFRIETVNAALVSHEVAETSQTITIDTIKPIIIANAYEADYDSSDYGTYKQEGTDYDSTYLDENYAPEGTYDLQLDAKNKNSISFEVSILHSHTAQTEDVSGEEPLPLPVAYGENVATVVGVDEAGNVSTTSYTMYYNDTPTLTELGEKYVNYGFNQVVTQRANWKTIDLNDCFKDECQLNFTVENLDEEAGEIKVTLNSKGILSFNYLETPTEDEPVISATILVTATDEFGVEAELCFVVSYVQDSEAPVWTELSLVGDPGLQQSVLASNRDTIELTGRLYDQSEIKSAELNIIYDAEGQEGEEQKLILEAFDLLKESSSGTTADGLVYEYTYEPDGDIPGGVFNLKLSHSDGTAMEEGHYFFYVSGTDILGNESEDADVSVVYIERSEPAISAQMTLQKTGTSSTTVNANPKFDVTLSDDEVELYGNWVQIYRITEATDGGTTEELYAQGKIVSGTCELKYNSKVLPEDSYNFRIQTIDAAGNTNETEEVLQVIVNKTKQSVSDLKISSKTEYSLSSGKLYIHSPLYVQVSISDDGILYYMDSEEQKVAAYNDEEGIELEFGSNVLYFWIEDSAGNVGDRKSFTFLCDHKPTLTEAASQLEDVTLSFPEDETSVVISLEKDELDAMVTDSDLAAGDELTPSFGLTLAEGVPADAVKLTWTTDESEANYLLTLTYDYDQIQDIAQLGTIAFKVTDSCGFSPEDPSKLLSFNLNQEIELESVTIEDASLKAVREESVSGTLEERVTVVETTVVDAGIKMYSTLSEETILQKDSLLSQDSFSDASKLLEEGVDYTLETQLSGLKLYRILRDVELPLEIVTDEDCTVSVTQIGENSILEAGTTLGSSVNVYVSNIEQVRSIYENFDEENLETFLTYTVPATAFTVAGLEVTGISLPESCENTVIKSIEWVEGTGLVVTYRPYQVDQNRSAVTIQLLLADASTKDYTVKMDYEKPFEYRVTVTSSKISDSVVENLPEEKTYISSTEGAKCYAQVWFTSNLPTSSEDFVELYDMYGLQGIVYLYINEEAASAVSFVGGFSTSNVQQYTEDGNHVLCIRGAEAKGLNDAPFCGADGTWFKTFEVEIVTTGQADLVCSADLQSVVYGFPFEYEITTGDQIGVKLDSQMPVSNSQVVTNTQKTIPVLKPASTGVLTDIAEVVSCKSPSFAMSLAENEMTVEETVSEPVVLESVYSTDEQVLSSAPVQETTTEESFGISAESWIQNPLNVEGCVTVTALNIVPEEDAIAIIQEMPVVQEAAKALTDQVFDEENEE